MTALLYLLLRQFDGLLNGVPLHWSRWKGIQKGNLRGYSRNHLKQSEMKLNRKLPLAAIDPAHASLSLYLMNTLGASTETGNRATAPKIWGMGLTKIV